MAEPTNPAVERRAADTILHRGVKFKLGAPWYIRWLKKTFTVTLRTPYLGTLLQVSRYYTSTGIGEKELDNIPVERSMALMAIHGPALSKALACALLNGYWKNKLFTRIVARYLRWHCKPQDLFALVTALVLYGGTADFMNTTRLARNMTVTEPRKGPRDQGS